MVNRVLPDEELAEVAALRPAAGGRADAGPPRHQADRAAFLEHGVRGADDMTAAIAAPLFETDDLQGRSRASSRKPWQGDVRGALMAFRRPALVAWCRQSRRKPA